MDSESLARIALQSLGGIAEVQVRHEPPRAPRTCSPVTLLHPRLLERLAEAGIEELFTHQAQAFDAAIQGKDVAVVTSTSSGKTLCYNLPVVQRSLEDPVCRAIYLFPTKALAHDQVGKLEHLSRGLGVRCSTYDGDTPKTRRAAIRQNATVLLTNPDMLHVGILPAHEQWNKFLRSLRYIVIDEMHAYRGVFGSHVAWVLRRLLRLCAWYGSHPQVIACSATIANPVDLFEKLVGRTPVLIDDDGSPRGTRSTILASLGEDLEDGPSPNAVSAGLLADLVANQVRTLAFCRARVSTELVARAARKRLSRAGVPSDLIESYRAGYTPEERRELERSLFEGRLYGLATTNAMEMGVDVGTLDAVLLNGFPGTVASFWQQAGRAGRGTRPGLAVMVAHEDPLEQLLVSDPELLFGSPVERVVVHPNNRYVQADQLRCATYERPISESELAAFGVGAPERAEELAYSGELQWSAGRCFYPSHEAPAPGVDLRGAGGGGIRLLVKGTELGTMEWWRALQAAHPGAVYLHRGQTYVVAELDLDRKEAHMSAQKTDHYTVANVQSVLEPLVTVLAEPWGEHRSQLTGLRATTMVMGYRKMALDGDTVMAIEDLHLPPNSFETVGIRLDLPGFDPERIETESAALHALEHALGFVAPILCGCDRSDLGSAWYAAFSDSLSPALFFFDTVPGGVGLCEALYERKRSWAVEAHKLLDSCPCDEGCPKCLLSARCEAMNQLLDKQGAIRLLRSLLA